MTPYMRSTATLARAWRCARGLVAEGEVARDHLQHQLVGGVEQVRAAAGVGVGDVDVGLDVLDRPHAGADDGMRGLEAGIGIAHLEVLGEHLQEAAVVRGPPVPGRPLALFDDALQRPVGARQVGDRHQVRPPERGLVCLMERRAR